MVSLYRFRICQAFCLIYMYKSLSKNLVNFGKIFADDCSAAATWLKPIKAVDRDLKGNDQSEYCKKVVRKNSTRCDSREFGYMCAGTCNIDTDTLDAPLTTTKKP